MTLRDKTALGMSLPHRSPDPLALTTIGTVARRAEELGFRDLWVTENTVDDGTCLDPVVALTFAASITQRIGVGAAVIVLQIHHPLTLVEALWKRLLIQTVYHRELNPIWYYEGDRPARLRGIGFAASLSVFTIALLWSAPRPSTWALLWPPAALIGWHLFGVNTLLTMVHLHVNYVFSGLFMLLALTPAMAWCAWRHRRDPIGAALQSWIVRARAWGGPYLRQPRTATVTVVVWAIRESGNHALADIGLLGKNVRIDGQLVDAVDVFIGGKSGPHARPGTKVLEDVPCDDLPEVLERIVPYVRQPEEIIPGKPLYFSSAFTMGGIASGLLVESNMGRPTKIEGNPEHPESLGATDKFAPRQFRELSRHFSIHRARHLA